MTDSSPVATPANARSTAIDVKTAMTLLIILTLFFGYAIVTFSHEMSDEGFHGPQVWNFFSGNNKIIPALTVPPTYHFVVAKLAQSVGFYSVNFIRLLSLCIGALGLIAVYRLAQRFSGEESSMRTAQHLLMPIAFPFFFLIYTDVWTLGAVMGLLLASLNERHRTAALFGLVALALRPTAIIWVGLALALASLSPHTAWKWRAQLRALWPYLVCCAAFIGFVVWNGGVAIGDRNAHKLGINLTNLWVFLMCAWVVFLPWNIMALPRIAALLRKPAVLGALALGIFIYMGSYSVTHPYNNPAMSDFLHNQFLNWLTQSRLLRFAFYIPVAWMLLTFSTIQLPERRLCLIFPAIIASVMLHPLIEPRYYLPGLCLLLLLRPSYSPRTDVGVLLVFAALSTALLSLSAATKYFL